MMWVIFYLPSFQGIVVQHRGLFYVREAFLDPVGAKDGQVKGKCTAYEDSRPIIRQAKT